MFLQLIRGIERHPFEIHSAHFVLTAFFNDPLHRDLARAVPQHANILQFEIDITFVAIKLGQLFLVIIQLVLLQAAAARQPRHEPPFAGFDLASQLLLRKRLRAIKVNARYLYLGCLSDLESHCRTPRALIGINLRLNLRLRVSRFLIHLFNFLGVTENLSVIDRIAHFDTDLLLYFARAVLFVADEIDVRDLWFALDEVSELDTVRSRPRNDFDVQKIPRVVEHADIVIHDRLAKR